MSLSNLLSVCFHANGTGENEGIPVLLWGPPGIGKSSIIADIAQQMNLPLEVVILSVREPSEITGIPFVTNGRVEIAPPIWMERLCKAGKGILFFDELTTAPPSVQSAALRIILDRVVGDTKLPNEVRIIAAANQTEFILGGWQLSPPLANRFCHVKYDGPSVAEWTSWLTTGTAVKPLTKPTDESLASEEAKAKGLIVTFLTRRNGGLLGPSVPKDPNLASKGWPSPRSWDMMMKIFACAKAVNVESFELIEGCIGEGAAKEFSVFVAYADLPDPAALVTGMIKFSHDPTRLDRTVAVTTSLAAYAVMFPDLSPKVWKLLSSITKKAKDLAMPAVQMLMKAGLFSSEEALTTIEEYGTLLDVK